MARILAELVAVFLIPFLAYLAFLVFVIRQPEAAKAMLKKKALLIQSLIGLGLMVLSLLAFGLSDEQHRGSYRPAEFKNGQLVPGKVE